MFSLGNKYPFAVLHFEISGEDIDVNVHPTKMEIRIMNPQPFCEFVKNAIIDTKFYNEAMASASNNEVADFSLPKQEAPTSFTESIKLGVQGVKQYMSSANITNKEITLDILNNTSTVSQSLKEWALDNFERMAKPLQKMAFSSIKTNKSFE